MCSVSKACKNFERIPTLLVYHNYLTLSSVYTFIFTELCICMAGLGEGWVKVIWELCYGLVGLRGARGFG